jgi:hypothetical protein
MPCFSSIPVDCHPDVSAVISVLLDLGLQIQRESHTQPGVAGSHLTMSDGYALGIAAPVTPQVHPPSLAGVLCSCIRLQWTLCTYSQWAVRSRSSPDAPPVHTNVSLTEPDGPRKDVDMVQKEDKGCSV